MTSTLLRLSIIASTALLTTSALAEETTLDPIVVSSDFREQKLSQTSNSVTVIGEEELYDKASQSFVETLGAVPNVNFSAGASKAKYIQIRGIGERSQFEAPVNPSVGLLMDGMDFSSITLGVGMFDVKQIEVLKGPQGTTFGANGLAGVVSVMSNEPTKETTGHFEAMYGNYNTKAFGLALGGTLLEDVLIGRISVYKNSSDGFMENSYLNRDDTNNIDELSIKTQLRWFASDNHTIDLNVIHVDIDNGYDAFTLDNTRTSQSDTVGEDTQKTDAFALKSTYDFSTMHLISKVSYSKTDSTYSYDEDWTYKGAFDASLWPYNYFDQYQRDIEQVDFDIRMVSDEEGKIFNSTTAWTLGLYAKKYDETLNRNRIKEGVANLSDNTYTSQNKALYGQLDTALNNKLTLVTGLRVEQWDAEYSDSQALNIDTDEVLTGGKIGLKYQATAKTLYYATLSKGYKAGGVNGGTSLSTAQKKYQTETLWNIETGINSSHFNDSVRSRLNVFYGKRDDQQVKLYQEATRSFENYLSNAGKGSYYGLESQLDFYPNDSLHLFTSIGLLKSEFDEYTPALEGRAPAQSPKYQYNVGFDYSLFDRWVLKANIEGKDAYYFSNTHDQKSEAYALVNASVEYLHGNFSARVWAKNLANEDYDVRGFFFGNNPATGYASELYTQKGNPRTFGLTLGYDF